MDVRANVIEFNEADEAHESTARCLIHKQHNIGHKHLNHLPASLSNALSRLFTCYRQNVGLIVNGKSARPCYSSKKEALAISPAIVRTPCL
ncbi:hypothetical protein KIN20_002123 [Parelaphostrongylus tenuis]|uniref:Uncharacterized protein n=1 Tax=Parelaphostrongylus tenuis TaxID=148309 RepID=A0AAD5LZC9_PARTN|nr:hypothetical protein KIN20_002123 [Parelaphostrongylus tenuis]